MEYPEYPRNEALFSFTYRLDLIRNTCLSAGLQKDKFLGKSNLNSEKIQYFFPDISNEFRAILNSSSNLPVKKSINRDVLYQVSNINNDGFDWKAQYQLLVDCLRRAADLCKEIETTFSSETKKLISEFFLLNTKLLYISEHCYYQILNQLIGGTVDQCILPTKNQMCCDIPEKGTVVAFDIVNSKNISEERRNNILDEARRSAFITEAWEWTDEGDSILLYFVDHEENPATSHMERALQTAIEIIARVTYKLPLGPDDYASHVPDEDRKHKFTQLRVVLYSLENDKIKMFNRLSTVKSILDDPYLKYHNTLMVIGETLFSQLNNSFETYKLNFSRALRKHNNIDEPIFWSSPIGWQTLKLFLNGSSFLNKYKRVQRVSRYQIPGAIDIDIKPKGAKKGYTGKIFDISQKGLRIILSGNPEDYTCTFKPSDPVLINGNKCPCHSLGKITGTVVYIESTKKGNTYIGVSFNVKLKSDKLEHFLENSNVQCSSECNTG